MCRDIANLDISAHFHRNSSALDASLHKHMETASISLHKSTSSSYLRTNAMQPELDAPPAPGPEWSVSSCPIFLPPWFWRLVGLLGPGDQQFHLVWHVLGGHRIGVVVCTGCEHAQGHRLVGMSSACAEISTEVHVARYKLFVMKCGEI